MVKLQQHIKLLLLNKLYVTLFIGFGFYVSKSQNLITNGSFENSTNINCGTGSFSAVNNWLSISSSDFFNNTCNPISYGTPVNRFGNQYPITGWSYIGIISYSKPYETKEYIQQNLSTPLIAGKTYYTSFYVSRVERFTMAIKNIGAFFSVSQPTVIGNTYFPATPQVENQTGFLTDTIGWTKIEGYFTAQGGEEYITIGNFNSNANTDTLYTGTNDPPPSNPDGAYYYIDSVSLYDSLTYVTNIKELKNEVSFNLYPNPNNGNFILQYDLGNNQSAEMLMYDVTGKVIFNLSLQNTEKQINMNVNQFENGIYYYSIRTNKEILLTNKFVIIK